VTTYLQGECPNAQYHGNPFRYCMYCDWMEAPAAPPVSVEPNSTLRYFAYEHLPIALQQVSRPLAEIAQQMDALLPNGPEKSVGFRKLLEAKDAFVRAALPPSPAYPLIPKDQP
jgi:hypothetical protein